MDGTYTATLEGSVTGKGKLVFTYLFNSYSSRNSFEFTKNGTRQFRYAYNGTVTRSGTVTNEVTSTGTTVFSWVFTIGAAGSDYDDRYSNPSGVWLSNVQWIPDEQGGAVVVSGVSVPYTWLDTNFPGQGTSAQAYETLATGDQDGDGFATWQEYLAGTDPTNAASYLQATIRMEGSTPVVEWNVTNSTLNALGYQYVPKGATNLTPPINWQPMNSTHRFFKVFIEPAQ